MGNNTGFYKMCKLLLVEEIVRQNEDSKNKLILALFMDLNISGFIPVQYFFLGDNENIWYVWRNITKSLDRIIM